MNRYLIYLLGIWIMTSCNVEPRAIAYGQDGCQHCKMILMDSKYGAELVTEKGKVFIFDDMNCLFNYMESPEGTAQAYKYILVADYLKDGELIDAKDAFYLKSEEFQTPMASQVVAFQDYNLLKEHKNKNGGIYLAWGELVTQFK